MNTIRLSNISLKDFRRFLVDNGCVLVYTSKGRGGHEKWKKPGFPKPVTLQTHVTPVTLLCIKANLQTLGLTRKDLEDWLLKDTKSRR